MILFSKTLISLNENINVRKILEYYSTFLFKPAENGMPENTIDTKIPQMTIFTNMDYDQIKIRSNVRKKFQVGQLVTKWGSLELKRSQIFDLFFSGT